jgi:N-acyl-D-aspartate/D-glutamate deacylase
LSGVPVPGTYAEESELAGIVGAMARVGLGTVEWVPGTAIGGWEARSGYRAEIEMMRRLADETGRPTIFQVNQVHPDPDAWRGEIAEVEDMVAGGIPAFPQVHGRGFCLLMGFDTSYHPFRLLPSWQPLAALPFDARIARLREPTVRKQLLSEALTATDRSNGFLQLEMVFSLGDPPRYEPTRDESMAAIAQQQGRNVLEVIYDCMLENEGRNLLSLQIVNYADYSLEPMRELLENPLTIVAGADGGAHCATASDASMPSFMLTHWVRDRASGRLPLECIVQKMTSKTAGVYGLTDRGVLAVGKKADINVIDLANLRLHPPEMRYDLPAGGKRLVQTADGYTATVVSGQITRRNGKDTGARPGKLIRGH